MQITEFNKGYETLWNDYLDKNPRASIFHTLEWKEIIEEVYKFKPLYFLAMENNEVKGIICSFLTSSIIFGKKIVSTPFNFYNQPLFENEEAGKLLINKLKEIGKKEKVKYIEIKALEDLSIQDSEMQKNAHYFISNLKLEDTEEKTEAKYYDRLRKNLRTLRRNAEKNNIKVSFSESEDDLKQFHNTLVKIYRDKHNMICQPYSLYKNMKEKFKERFKLLVAKQKDKVIGGMILFFFKNQAVYAYGASDLKYKTLSPGTVLVDYAIKHCSKSRYKTLDFGVTSQHQTELLNFKQNWGTTEHKMPYYYIPITQKEINPPDYYTYMKNLRKPFKYVPLPIIKIASPIITRQLG
ncbi:MAG: GNAT family N-acetyltransferase [Candidatus Nanoarchaeia archaeon]|nr:GNAT family N-acetyltransferase [Candidatus Nanoarchaeia archaeon]